jgi:hypothetical protein
MTQARDESIRRRDDRLAIGAAIVGAGVALAGYRMPMELAGGLGLGMGGAFLALRGERAISAYRWLRGAFALVLLSFIVTRGLGVYQDWVASQWFAEGGNGPGDADIDRIRRAILALRTVELAAGLSFLLGALANRGQK